MLKKDKDYYAVLHLDPSADATMVQRAYWHLARTLQAAAHSDPSAHQRLEQLNEAYSVLGTPALRAEYDQARLAIPPEPAPKEAPGPKPTVPLEKPRKAPRVSTLSVAAAWFPRPTHRRQPLIDPADLRASTAATIARWRKRAEAAPPLRVDERSEEATPSTDSSDDPPR